MARGCDGSRPTPRLFHASSPGVLSLTALSASSLFANSEEFVQLASQGMLGRIRGRRVREISRFSRRELCQSSAVQIRCLSNSLRFGIFSRPAVHDSNCDVKCRICDVQCPL